MLSTFNMEFCKLSDKIVKEQYNFDINIDLLNILYPKNREHPTQNKMGASTRNVAASIEHILLVNVSVQQLKT